MARHFDTCPYDEIRDYDRALTAARKTESELRAALKEAHRVNLILRAELASLRASNEQPYYVG